MNDSGKKIIYGAAAAGAGYLLWPFIRPFLYIVVLFAIAEAIFTYESDETQKAKRQHKIQLQQKWEKERVTSLNKRMKSNDLVAQTILATDYLYNDIPSDDSKGMEMLIDAANKDCAKAQDYLAGIYHKKGNRTKSLELWLLAAKGKENRKYGTGSYQARRSIKYFFPEKYDNHWDDE